MFPVVNDMNLVVCGLATFAATVGYACSRRLSVTGADSPIISPDSSTSTSDSKAKVEEASSTSKAPAFAPSKEILTASPSLKRKRTQDDEEEDSSADVGYPDNLQLIYPPKKRSRTPSDTSENDSAEVIAEIFPSPTVPDAPEVPKTPESPSEDDSVLATPPPITPAPSPRIVNAIERPATPPHVVFGTSATISSPLPKSIQPAQRPVSSKAFSAFARSGSAFSTASPSKSSNLKPAWSMPDLNKNAIEEPSRDVEEEDTSSHVLVAATTSNVSAVECPTGEEHEDVDLELKGVKMYIKRGDKPFSDGMQGNIKLLSDKTTKEQRLLFRREPLWQVTMNVRLHPSSVRCTFDATENVLRIILTEVIDKKDVREIVIYALKPGRSCLKQDFKEFAEAFMKNPRSAVKAEPES